MPLLNSISILFPLKTSSIKFDVSRSNHLFIPDVHCVLFQPTDLGNDLGNSLSTVIAPKISTHYYHLNRGNRKICDV